MKKRNPSRKQRKNSPRTNALSFLSARRERRSKSFTFERLEERFLFTASPASPAAAIDYSTLNGVLTPEQETMGEMWWAFKQASDLSHYTPEQLQNATQWATWSIDPNSGSGGAATFNPYTTPSDINTVTVHNISSADVIAQLSANPGVMSFYPLIEGLNASTTMSPIDEPLFESEWHLRNTGQIVNSSGEIQPIRGVPGEDVNVVSAWNQGVSGRGVLVAVVDSGFQTNHPDLSVNYVPDLSTPFGPISAGSHGTAVAGIIAADGSNNYGAVGIAYNASLVNLDLGLDTGFPTAIVDRAMSYRNDAIDIYSMSIGNGGSRAYVPLTPDQVTILRNAVLFGRPDANGKPLGNIYVIAAGNDGGADFEGLGFGVSGHWDGANYNGRVSSRYTIAVTGVDHDGTYFNSDGTVTDYPTAGASVLIAAPTGSVSLDVGLDTGNGSGITTTDLVGDAGYNQAGITDGDFLSDPNFTSRFNGTSAATPMVSGVVALMLEANPNLTWRDVQEILLRSARQNDPTNEGWQANLIESWESPAIDFMTGIPLEDPFLRSDVFRGGGGNLAMIHPIDNYSVYQSPIFANGAGYTVNDARGLYSEEYGWAHGVVDAGLAVSLAKQWSTKEQMLAPELTYTTFVRPGNRTIPSAARVGPTGNTSLYIVPGIMRNGTYTPENFHQFYQEFFATTPFTGTPPPFDDNGAPLPISLLQGFTPPLMKIETVEVKLTITGVDVNQLRVAVRSPDGTVSELNTFMEQVVSQNVNNLDQDEIRQDPGNTPVGPTFSFTTNRSWGERSDSFFEVDSATGLLKLDPDTGFPIPRTWDLIVENYGGTAGAVTAFEVVFHGTPLGAGTERVQGKVGVDSGRLDGTGAADGDFNFTRSIGIDTSVPADGTPDTFVTDTNPEPFASNVTVRARLANGKDAGQIVSTFVTGADGNYYFDLAPTTLDINGATINATYTIEVNDPLGRLPKQDNAIDPQYKSTWTIDMDPNDLYTRIAGREVAIDTNNDGIPDQSTFRYDNDINFLLDAGTQPPPTVDVNGTVYADVNGNGVIDGVGTAADAPAAGFRVYADLNHSGSFEQSEPSAISDENGKYHFVINSIMSQQNISIVAIPLSSGWVPTKPIAGQQTILRGPGDVVTDLNFLFIPPPDADPSQPPDASKPGTILGQVFNDKNGDGIQGGSDIGVAGVRVFVDTNGDNQFSYVDANSNGVFDTGDTAIDPTAVTTDSGGYFITGIAPGLQNVYVVVPANFTATAPVTGVRAVTVVGGGVTNNVKFGIRNLATSDFGDLPDTYHTTLASNGPRHTIIPGFQLGTKIDGEVNGQPSADAKGDDLVSADEDGVVLLGASANPTGVLVPGALNSVKVTVQGVGGYLNAWMDFNNNGVFDAGEHLSEITDLDLNPGTYTLTFATPANMAVGPIAARFRWGTAGLSFDGSAIIGEVEDYFFATSNGSPNAVTLAGDYNGDNVVNQADFNLWKATFNSTTNLAADGNGDGIVDGSDYAIWQDNYGHSTSGAGAGGGGGSVVVHPDRTLSGQAALDYLQSRMNGVDAATAAKLLAAGATTQTTNFGGLTNTIYVWNPPVTGNGGGGSATPPIDMPLTMGSSNAPATASSSPTSDGTSVVTVTPEQSAPEATVDQPTSNDFSRLRFTTTASPTDSTAIFGQRFTSSDTSANALLLLDLALTGDVDTANSGADDADLLGLEHRDSDDANLRPELVSVFEGLTDWRWGV